MKESERERLHTTEGSRDESQNLSNGFVGLWGSPSADCVMVSCVSQSVSAKYELRKAVYTSWESVCRKQSSLKLVKNKSSTLQPSSHDSLHNHRWQQPAWLYCRWLRMWTVAKGKTKSHRVITHSTHRQKIFANSLECVVRVSCHQSLHQTLNELQLGHFWNIINYCLYHCLNQHEHSKMMTDTAENEAR